MLEFLSFCVTWHLHDGRESCDVGLNGDLFRGIRRSDAELQHLPCLQIMVFLKTSHQIWFNSSSIIGNNAAEGENFIKYVNSYLYDE